MANPAVHCNDAFAGDLEKYVPRRLVDGMVMDDGAFPNSLAEAVSVSGAWKRNRRKYLNWTKFASR